MKNIFNYWLYGVGKLLSYIPTQFGVIHSISRYYLIILICFSIAIFRIIIQSNTIQNELLLITAIVCTLSLCFICEFYIDKYVILNYEKIIREVTEKQEWKRVLSLVFSICFFLFSIICGLIDWNNSIYHLIKTFL